MKMHTDNLTEEDLEILTEAFMFKAKTPIGPETEDERLRGIIQMVIIDTMLTVEGAISIDNWKPEHNDT